VTESESVVTGGSESGRKFNGKMRIDSLLGNGGKAASCGPIYQIGLGVSAAEVSTARINAVQIRKHNVQ
jgi:hypothetical protein